MPTNHEPRRRSRTEPCLCINQLISNYNLSAPLFAVVHFAYDKDVCHAHNADSVVLAMRGSTGPTCHWYCLFSFRSALGARHTYLSYPTSTTEIGIVHLWTR